MNGQVRLSGWLNERDASHRWMQIFFVFVFVFVPISMATWHHYSRYDGSLAAWDLFADEAKGRHRNSTFSSRNCSRQVHKERVDGEDQGRKKYEEMCKKNVNVGGESNVMPSVLSP